MSVNSDKVVMQDVETEKIHADDDSAMQFEQPPIIVKITVVFIAAVVMVISLTFLFNK